MVQESSVQGVIWKSGYESGQITGHVYDDVPAALNQWRAQGIKIGVFSSGSVAAQKLLFRYTDFGDLSVHFSQHFDTTTGSKKDDATYVKIAQLVGLQPEQILFLSDVSDELVAAEAAGMHTIQLLRQGTASNWPRTVKDFLEI